MVPRLAPLAGARHHLADGVEELLAERAAGAAVLELDHVLLPRRAAAARRLGRHQALVNVDLRDVVDDDANLEPQLVLQQVLEQRRLARTEESRQDRHRHDVPLRPRIGTIQRAGPLGQWFGAHRRVLRLCWRNSWTFRG
jgi:hypothetical protein